MHEAPLIPDHFHAVNAVYEGSGRFYVCNCNELADDRGGEKLVGY